MYIIGGGLPNLRTSQWEKEEDYSYNPLTLLLSTQLVDLASFPGHSQILSRSYRENWAGTITGNGGLGWYVMWTRLLRMAMCMPLQYAASDRIVKFAYTFCK